ncbi:MAG: penicillin-binding protein [Crocinitomicaceae bacterium]
MYLYYIFFVLFMVAIVVKVFAIQYDSIGDFLKDDDLEEKVFEIPAIRGDILAEEGEILSTSVPIYEIRMDVKTVKKELLDEKVDSLGMVLTNLLQIKTPREWVTYIRENRDNQFLLIKRKVPHDIKGELEKAPIFSLGPNKGGFIAIPQIIRKRPNGALAARTVGVIRESGVNVGIEGAFNTFLAGTPGKELRKKVSGGWKPIPNEIQQDPVTGYDVWTTIDLTIQDVAETELERQLQEQDAKLGCVIVMEVETGKIKAIANLSKGTDGKYYEDYNHAIGRSTEPGSTFKLASIMALLEDGKMSLNDLVNAKGKYKFYDSYLHDSKPGGYGMISLKKAFEVSSNVIAEAVNNAYKNTPQDFVDRIKSFGLGDPLGILLKGEPDPTIRNAGDEGWSGISIPWMSIGYEVRLTPLQILTFYNGVANNGVVMKPYFVSKVMDGNKTIQTYGSEILNPRLCSPSTLVAVKSCLEGVVENGTGKSLQAASFKIAGKTGTARIAQNSAGYGNDKDVKHQASFVGYFPADNPKYSCIVVIAAPNKDIYGSKVSGTVFTKIANKVNATSLNFHEAINDLPNVNSIPKIKNGRVSDLKSAMKMAQIKYGVEGSDFDWGVSNESDSKVKIEKRYIGPTVPNVVGMGLKDALYLLENRGLVVVASGVGRVTSQSVEAGSEVIKGTKIQIELN